MFVIYRLIKAGFLEFVVYLAEAASPCFDESSEVEYACDVLISLS